MGGILGRFIRCNYNIFASYRDDLHVLLWGGLTLLIYGLNMRNELVVGATVARGYVDHYEFWNNRATIEATGAW